ncbi:MAG TPA: hypothetical protein VKP67_12885 [Xanthobacteraceae bacterium]|nr:hypothetical protein [Xanthobacteraceae bacterium]
MTSATFGIVALIGATLGFRFKVLILFPAISFAVLGAAAIGMARGDHGHDVIATTVLVAVALQTGYLLGLVARAVVMLSFAPLAKWIWAHDRRPFRKGGDLQPID